MECLVLILTLIGLTVLFSIYSNLNHIRKETKTIMSKQEEFNAKLEALNTSLTNLSQAIANESQQIRDAIAGEAVDISALDGVATRLAGLVTDVDNLVVAPSPEEEPGEGEGEGDGE